MPPTIPNDKPAGQSTVESHLKAEFESNQILTDASKLLGFLASLESAYSHTWSTKDAWESAQVTPGISLGGISFSTLGEATSPLILIRAVTKILSDKWPTISALEAFKKAGANFDAARSFLKELQQSDSPYDVANNLKALIVTLNPASDEQEQAKGEFPFALKNAFFNTLRPEGALREKEWTKLGLQELRTQLDAKFSALTKQKNDDTSPWNEQNETILKELSELREKHEAWLVTWKDARKNVVENRLKNFTFTGIDKIDKTLFLNVFAEHTPESFNSQDESVVAAAALAFWEDLVTRKLPTDDPTFYFRSSVLAAYDAYNKALQQLTTEHSPQAGQLQAQIAKALNLQISQDEKITPEDGGGAATDESDTTASTPPDADTRSRQQNRWTQLLKRLDTLQQGLEGIPDSPTNATVVGSLQRFAEKFGISGALDTIDAIVLTLNVSLASWAENLTVEETASRLDEFDRLLQASEELLAQTRTQHDTPGEAARKAQEAAAAAAVPATPTAEPNILGELDQLKDLSKLHHSHAALTAMALAQLEAELKKLGYSEQEIQRFLKENQPALAQYLWAQYLGQLQGTATTPLSSAEVFRLAVSSSLFFVDKFELEKGVRTAPLGPDSLRRAQTGELTPELRERLLAIAKQHNYNSPEELFAALFGNGDRAISLAEFIRRAEYAASLNPQKIEAFSRALVQQYLGPNSSDDLLERLMATLEKDQYSLDEFFSISAGRVTPEQRQKWEQLKPLLTRLNKEETLTEAELALLNKLLIELGPILAPYAALGPAFYTLRQSDGFRHFLGEASRFGQMEASLVEQADQTQQYVPLIPRQLYMPGTPVMVMRMRTETTEISFIQQTKQPRFNLALESMVALSLAEQGTAEYEAAYMAMVQAQLAEAGINYPPGDFTSSQLRSSQSWTTRAYQQAGRGDGAAVTQMMAQVAGGGQKRQMVPLVGLKNPVVRAALIKATMVAVPTLGVGYLVYKAVKPILDVLNGISNFFGGGTITTAASSAATVAPSVASAVGNSVADGASNVAINAKSIASEQLAKASTVANTSGAMVKTAMTAITTTAAIAPAVVAAGILGPMLGMMLLTIIVWSVIGNSLNDYGGLGVARQGLGIEGCWPTTGTITQLDTPDHRTADDGSALDIGAGELTEIYTPFSGRAKAFAEDPTAPPLENNGGYGNYVRVYTDLGFDLIFAHMKAIEIPDGEQLVVAGQLIGGVGTTGNSDGEHLHYELRDVRGIGMRITDVTPASAAEIRLGMAVSAYECAQPSGTISPSASGSPSPSPSTLPAPSSIPGPGIDPGQLGDLTQPLPTTPPENL